MDVLLAGATGLVGKHVLQQLLADARCTGVVAITRRDRIASSARIVSEGAR